MATDYEELAKKFGGQVQTDYEGLAKKFGGSISTEEPPQPARTAPVRAAQAQPTRPTPTPVTAPVEPTMPSGRMPTAFTTEVGGVDITGMGSALEMEAPVSVSDIASQKDKLDIIQRYMKERFPNKPMPKEPVKLVEEFQRSQAKTDMGLGRELTWALNAKPEQKEVARQAYGVAQELGTTFPQEFAATVMSPSTYVGGVGGWAVKQALLKPAVVSATKKAIAITGTTAALEGGAAGVQDVIKQRTEKELGLREEMSYAQTALSVGVATALGAVGGKGVADIKAEQAPARVASLVQRKKGAPELTDKQTADFLKQFAAKEKSVGENRKALFADSFARREARKETLDKMDAPGVVTEAVLNESTVADIFKVAKQIYIDNPLLRPDLNEVRITQAVANTLKEADVDTIQQAAARAGVNNKEFLETFRVTLSQAGATLKEASSLAQFLNKATQGDPELEEALKKMARASSGTEYWSGKALETTTATVGASVAASTASLSTAVLNAIGLAGSVPLKVAADTVDAVYSTAGRMLYDMRGGVLTKDRAKEDVSEAFADSFFVLKTMADAGYTSEVTDLMLKNQPRLNNLLSSVGAETDSRGLPASVAKVMNTINIANRAVDSVVRRPIFLQAVKDRMDAVGLDYEDFIANDKAIPVALLKEAADDALKLTFSYEFKKTGERSFEGAAESLAASTLQLFNSNGLAGIPGKLIHPFMRFSLNSIRYTYRMTPASALGGIQELRQARKFLNEGKKAEAAGLAYDAKKKILDATVGTSVIYGAMAFREDNSDLEFYQYRDDDGNVQDGSGLFPFVNIAALAEVSLLMRDMSESLWYTLSMSPEQRQQEADKFRKQAESLALNEEGKQAILLKAEQLELERVRKFDGQKFTEIMTGMGRSSFSQNSVFDRAARLVEEGITTDVARKAGTEVGDFLGRFDNFFNPAYDAVNFLLEDYSVVDTRAPVEGLGTFAGAVAAPVLGPIPGARGFLEERPSLFQTTPQQVPTVLRQLQGVRPTPPTSVAENELARLRIPSFSLYKSTGDRTLDNLTIREAAPLVEAAVDDLVNKDKAYPFMSINEQRRAMKSRISQAISIAKTNVQDAYLETNPEKSINRMFEGLGKEKRDAAVDRFIKTEKRRPETLRDKLRIIHGEFDIAEAIGKDFNKGGFVLRR
jgi:hypothetical protein